jgi:hypothetical protein
MKKFSEYLDKSIKIVNEDRLTSGRYYQIIKMLSSEDLKKFKSATQTIVDSLRVENGERAVDDEEIIDFIYMYAKVHNNITSKK